MAKPPAGRADVAKPRNRNGKGDAFDDTERAWMVTQLAHYLTPQQVADAFVERFGRVIDRRQVQRYDPNGCNGRKLGSRWREIHAEARKAFLEELNAIPIANKAVRLRQLQVFFDKAVARNNHGLAASLLEQAAKEAGGVHTNERKVSVSGRVAHEVTSVEEKRNLIADRLAEALERKYGAPVAPGAPPPTTH